MSSISSPEDTEFQNRLIQIALGNLEVLRRTTDEFLEEVISGTARSDEASDSAHSEDKVAIAVL
jgi:hypothetical protein